MGIFKQCGFSEKLSPRLLQCSSRLWKNAAYAKEDTKENEIHSRAEQYSVVILIRKLCCRKGRKDRRKKKEMVKVSVKSFIERAQVALFLWPAIITFRSRLDVSFPYLLLRKCRLSKQRYQYQLELAF